MVNTGYLWYFPYSLKCLCCNVEHVDTKTQLEKFSLKFSKFSKCYLLFLSEVYTQPIESLYRNALSPRPFKTTQQNQKL